jgi:hypothetical protein
MATIHKHVLRVARKTLQGGIPNDRYPKEYLTNFRLIYVHPTDAILTLKGFALATNDAHFYDAVCGDQKAEGKCVNKTGVNFNPSKNTGAGRSFKQDDLDKCFEINHFYFLYEVEGYDEVYLTFNIYWVPIATVREWYGAYGSQGKITLKRFREKCLAGVVIEQTSETRD